MMQSAAQSWGWEWTRNGGESEDGKSMIDREMNVLVVDFFVQRLALPLVASHGAASH